MGLLRQLAVLFSGTDSSNCTLQVSPQRKKLGLHGVWAR